MKQPFPLAGAGLPDAVEEIVGIHWLRGVASLGVVVHHALEESSSFMTSSHLLETLTLLGASGVDLFFVISGFIMLHTSRHLFGRPGAGADFAVRRMIRIAPLYWLCTFLVVALAATGMFYKSRMITGSGILFSLAFLPTDHIVHGIGWTLQYEMYFYLLFALALTFFTLRRAVWLIPATIICVLAFARLALPASPARTLLADPIAVEFAFGLLIAYAFSLTKRLPVDARVLACLGVIGLIMGSAFGAHASTNGLDSSVRFLFWGIPAAFIVASVLTLKSVKGRITDGFMWLGNISYSLYLTHSFVMIAYAKALTSNAAAHRLPPVLGITIATFASIAIANVVYILFEKPMTIGLRAVWRARKSAHPNGPPVSAT